jgi:hypothetical protein
MLRQWQHGSPTKLRASIHQTGVPHEQLHMQVLELVPALHRLCDGTDVTEDERAAADNAEQEIKAIVEMAKAAVQKSGADAPPALTELVLVLHDHALLSVPHSPFVQDAVVKLCMDYWLAEAPDAHAVSVQMVRCAANVAAQLPFALHGLNVP